MAQEETIVISAAEDAPLIVAQGNLVAENIDGVFETDDQKFADWIVSEGFGEVAIQDYGYPDDFPARAKLENLGVSFSDLQALDAEQIGNLSGIGDKTVEAIATAISEEASEGSE